MNDWKKESLEFIIRKTIRNNYSIGSNFPHASHNKKYVLENERWWTAGFWPGILWKVYSYTKNEDLRTTAEECENKMGHLLNNIEKVDHDLGFMWTLSSVANYKITKNEKSRQKALLAASILMSRFNLNGSYIRAWNSWKEDDDNRGVAIIDCLMNLPLLYWASIETNDNRFRLVAERFVETVLDKFIREDGSVYHMVIFNPETGDVIKKAGGQGFSSNSSWSRGCAWAIYGLALSYKYLKEERILNYAKRVANYFIANISDKKCPLWDFRIPEDTEYKKYSYLDSSAGAIAACGMLLLGDFMPSEESKLYKEIGEEILKNLYLECSSKSDIEEQGLLLHGTGNFPEQKNLDVPLIYGDYFFVEGICTLNSNNNRSFW